MPRCKSRVGLTCPYAAPLASSGTAGSELELREVIPPLRAVWILDCYTSNLQPWGACHWIEKPESGCPSQDLQPKSCLLVRNGPRIWPEEGVPLEVLGRRKAAISKPLFLLWHRGSWQGGLSGRSAGKVLYNSERSSFFLALWQQEATQ